MTKKVFILAAAMFFALQAHSGGVSDGGGDAVVCTDNTGNVISAELFDLYEARNLYGFNLLHFEKNEILDRALIAAQNIDLGGAASDPSVVANGKMILCPDQGTSDFVQAYTRYVHQNMKLLPPGVGLNPIEDTNNIIIPTNCQLVQLARYQDSHDKIFVAGDTWKYLNKTNKAALLVHEALYKKLRMNGETTSERARIAVGAAFAGNSLTPITEGVPAEAMLCRTDKDEFRFAVYKKGARAVYQFFRINGKVPLTKTTVETDVESSPLAQKLNGGISTSASVQDSILDQGYRVHWTFQKNSSTGFEMTLGGVNEASPVTCGNKSQDTPPGPWPWDLTDGAMSFTSSYIVPDAAVSCYGSSAPGGTPPSFDISEAHIRLNRFSIEWYVPDADLYIVAIKVNFTAPNGMEYTAMIAGDELASLDGSHGSWSAVLKRGDAKNPTVFNASCSPTVGGISIPANEPSFSVPGTVTIVGFSHDDQGNEKPVKIEKTFSVNYLN